MKLLFTPEALASYNDIKAPIQLEGEKECSLIPLFRGEYAELTQTLQSV